MTESQQRDQKSEHPDFHPLGGTEDTEQAEFEEHDRGVDSSQGEPAAAGGMSGDFPDHTQATPPGGRRP